MCVHELFAVSLPLVLSGEVCDLQSPSWDQSFLPSLIGLLALHSFVQEIPTTVFTFTPAGPEVTALPGRLSEGISGR
jgi:hypothetical protein